MSKRARRPKSATDSPYFGWIWFLGSRVRRAAAIYGTVNGWAVAALEWPDARDVINGSRDARVIEHTDDALVVTTSSTGATDKVPIDKQGMAWFDGGWSLYHEREMNPAGVVTLEMPHGIAKMLRIHRRGGSGYGRG